MERWSEAYLRTSSFKSQFNPPGIVDDIKDIQAQFRARIGSKYVSGTQVFNVGMDPWFYTIIIYI